LELRTEEEVDDDDAVDDVDDADPPNGHDDASMNVGLSRALTMVEDGGS